MDEQTSQQILVVDDDAAVRDVICRVLEKNGYAVLTAADGSAAIQQVTAHGATLALVLLDMALPGLTGEQIFEVLHKLQPDLHFLLFTARYDENTLLSLCQTGFCEIVKKPCTMNELRGKVAATMSRYPRVRQLDSCGRSK